MITWGLPGMIDGIIDASNIMSIQDNMNAVQDSVKIFTEQNNLTPQFVLKGIDEISIPSTFSPGFNTLVVFILPLFSFGLAMVLSILVVVKEKPIARLLLTPVKRFEILLSKYITYATILSIQSILLIFMSVSQGLYCAGSLLDLFVALFMGLP